MEVNNQLCIERENIDSIDLELVRLLDKRLEIVQNIAEIKQKSNLPIFQSAREQEKLAEIERLSSNPNSNKEIFKTIINQSRKFQEALICK